MENCRAGGPGVRVPGHRTGEEEVMWFLDLPGFQPDQNGSSPQGWLPRLGWEEKAGGGNSHLLSTSYTQGRAVVALFHAPHQPGG